MLQTIENRKEVIKHPDVMIEDGGGFADASTKTLDAIPGDTVQFGTSEYKFRVEFEPWPFTGSGHEVINHELLTFEKIGAFIFRCYVTPKGHLVELPYRKGDGGNGNVRPPGH